jgi:hypothetical protein
VVKKNSESIEAAAIAVALQTDSLSQLFTVALASESAVQVALFTQGSMMAKE